MNKKKIIVAVTGASGSVYAHLLLKKLEKLNNQIANCSVVLSGNAQSVWEYELDNSSFRDISFNLYENNDLFAPIASGSAGFDAMIICPCSMGTLGRIASGISSDLVSRAADVMLKERKKLILVTREMPLNLIHIRNMQAVAEAGGIICPASPSFYSKPENLESVLETVIDKVLSLAGFEVSGFKWGENS